MIKAVDVHVLFGQVTGVDGQHVPVDMLQGVHEAPDFGRVCNHGRPALLRPAIVDVQRRSPGPVVGPIRLHHQVVPLFPAIKDNPGWCLLEVFHHPFFFNPDNLFLKIHLRPVFGKQLQGAAIVYGKACLFQNKHGRLVDGFYIAGRKGPVENAVMAQVHGWPPPFSSRSRLASATAEAPSGAYPPAPICRANSSLTGAPPTMVLTCGHFS